jgi:quercetin dioxygenase-like cupin family protein
MSSIYRSSVSKTPVEPVRMEGADGVTVQWLLRKEHGVPNFEMRRFTVARGGHTPHHKHPFEHEIYVLSGQGTLVHEGEESALHPEDVVYVPGGDMHQFLNAGDAPVVFMCLVPRLP